MAVVMSGVAIECEFGARCREMLAGPAQGATCRAYRAVEGRHGGDHNPPKRFAGGVGLSRCQEKYALSGTRQTSILC